MFLHFLAKQCSQEENLYFDNDKRRFYHFIWLGRYFVDIIKLSQCIVTRIYIIKILWLWSGIGAVLKLQSNFNWRWRLNNCNWMQIEVWMDVLAWFQTTKFLKELSDLFFLLLKENFLTHSLGAMKAVYQGSEARGKRSKMLTRNLKISWKCCKAWTQVPLEGKRAYTNKSWYKQLRNLCW